MRSRTIGLMLFGGLLLIMMLTVLAFGSGHAKADPPASGDWVISSSQAYTDKNFIVNGSLIVQNNGRLTLVNTTIRMNPGADGAFSVRIDKGGTLLVRDKSSFTSYSGKKYGFMAYNQSTLEITKSTIIDAGWAWGGNGSSAGVFLDTTAVTIQDSTFVRDYYGVVDNGRDLTIINCKFLNITNAGIYANSATVTVQNSQFKWAKMGIKVVNGVLVADNISVLSNAYGFNFVNSEVSIEASQIKYNYFDLFGQNSTITVSNSTMWSDDYEVDLVNGTSLSFMNTTFNDQALAYDDNADTIDIWWFARVHVTWQNGNPADGANITVTDGQGTIKYEGNVSSDGWTGDQGRAQELTIVSGPTGSVTYFTPHNITVSKNGVQSTVYVAFLSSKDVEIQLNDLLVPHVNIVFPATSVAVNSMPYSMNGTAWDNESGLKSVEISAGSPIWDLANGTDLWTYDLNMSYDGVYLVSVRATDMVGNTYTAAFFLTLDTKTPFLDIYGPLNNTLTNASFVNVTGMALLDARVTVNGLNTTIDNHTGVWSCLIPLSEGQNQIVVIAESYVHNKAQINLTVVRDSIAPNLQVGSPGEGLVTNVRNITASGSTELSAKITFNGRPIFTNNGQFNTLFKLQDGLNQIHIRATDPAGNYAEVIINVTFDNEPPFIIVAAPADNFVSASNNIMVKGLTEPGATVVVGGFPATNVKGVFNINLTLKDGLNAVIIKATDMAGNEKLLVINITFDNVPPALTIDFPTNNMQTSANNVSISGTIEGAKALWINGHSIDLTKITDKRYTYSMPLAVGNNPVTIRAEDNVGNVVEKNVNVVRAKAKSTNNTKPMLQRLFDFNDPLGLIFLLAIIVVIVGCIGAGVMAARAPKTAPSRPMGPPPERDGRDGSPPYRGGPPGRRPPPPRRPDYRQGAGGPPPRRPGGYPSRPQGQSYAGPTYSPEPEPPAPAPPEPVYEQPATLQPVEYAPQPEPVVEEEVLPQAKVVEYEPEPTPLEAAPEPGIPEIPKEEPPAADSHDALEASIQNILTTLDTKTEAQPAPEVVPMTLPVEIKDESPKTRDVMSEITCPNCRADIKSSWATCPFCDYNLKGGPKPSTKAGSFKDTPKVEEPEPAPKEEPKPKVLPTKAVDSDIKAQDTEDTPKAAPTPPPAPKEAPPPPPKPGGKDGKNLDDILKKLKIG
jgi:hypothetical protein